ncbi:UNVERIFIED_CONTAM: hypothetical protein Sangu_3217600 [Sesamum angustifolium]|uniref:Uncharacterized protein n=1 Tax=Sesamum angustifolium TaxID=2727405 RepID=A0AAW2JJ49_9LAMI
MHARVQSLDRTCEARIGALLHSERKCANNSFIILPSRITRWQEKRPEAAAIMTPRYRGRDTKDQPPPSVNFTQINPSLHFQSRSRYKMSDESLTTDLGIGYITIIASEQA